MKSRSEIEDQNYEVLYDTDDDFNNRIKYLNMKRIKEFGASEKMCGIIDGKVVLFTNVSHDHFDNEELFTIYDPKEIYILYKLLQKADQEGGFSAFEDEEIFFEIK